MKLKIRLDGSGSELNIHDVDIVVSINDLWIGPEIEADDLPVSGYVIGSVFRSLRFSNQLYTLREWEGIAYAAWANSASRRGLYADCIPDVGKSWTATKGGTPITWPDWMNASWAADEMANTVVTGS